MLNDLFAQLRTAAAPVEIEALQNGIWQLWLTPPPGSDATGLAKGLEAGMRAMQADDFGRAILDFSSLILVAPAWAEAWNKRATAYYLRGEYRAALADVAETLRREPRHFGALGGQVTMLRQLGAPRQALAVLGKLAALCPALPGLREQQHALREDLDER